MTAQGYKYLSPPSAHTVGILLFTRHISTSLSRIAIHKGLFARCDSTRASRTYTVIFVSWALCGLIVEFVVFHYMIFALGINTIFFKLDFCLYSTSRQATLLYSSTIPQGCYSQNRGPILLLGAHWTYFWKHNIYYKKTPKLVAKILATKFGFVPDWYMYCTPERQSSVIILGMSSANERLRYIVVWSLIGWARPNPEWPLELTIFWCGMYYSIFFYTPVFRRDVLWYGAVRPSVRPSISYQDITRRVC